MGSTCTSERREPSADSYGDKLLKYVTVPAITMLGVVSLIVLYLVDKVSCYEIPGNNNVGSKVELHCFNSFRLAIKHGSKWSEERQLMHKIFPILLLCQALSFVILIILWFWCLSRNLTNQISSVIDYCDNLTDYYRKYDKGMRKNVTEATLHREIDNCLEFIIYLLTKKAKKIYIYSIIKWTSLILLCYAWFVGYFVIILPDLVIFQDNFTCLFDDVPVQKVADCTVPTSTFLRAVWYINEVLLGLLSLVAWFHVIELCRRKKFSSSFFYRTIPGLQDGRLAECVDRYYNPRHIYLLSQLCDSNIHLCADSGLSKSLTRKYGAPDGLTPGKATIVDKHYPVIQPEQLKKFRQSSEEYFRKKKLKIAKTVKTVQVHPVTEPNLNVSGKKSTKSKQSDGVSGKISGTSGLASDRSVYMTSHLLGRKLEKDLKSLRSSRGQGSIHSTPRTPRSHVRLDDLSINMATPRPHMDYRPRDTGHYPAFTSRNREFNPDAYNLDLTIRRNYAASMNTWK